jgi:hypothetical protein
MLSYLRHLSSRLASPPPAAPAIILVPAADARALTAPERLEIRDWLALPATQRALALVEARHPGLQTARLAKVARSEWDQLAAVNFLNRIHGWESYRNTLLTLAEPPATVTEPVETYPNA